MQPTAAEPLASLYESDETAWLDEMARLAAARRVADLDLAHLAEFLTDMAHRDRREVRSRLVVLLAHRLKWEYQPEKRTTSWRLTLLEQRRELDDLLKSRTLRNHAADILSGAYADAAEAAAVETGLPEGHFPTDCPYTVEHLLAKDFLAE